MEGIFVPDLTVKDVATELAVNPETVKRMLQSGRLPGYKVGRLWRTTREAVDRFKLSTANAKNEADEIPVDGGR
jgi:excisionase family DNA binding protein